MSVEKNSIVRSIVKRKIITPNTKLLKTFRIVGDSIASQNDQLSASAGSGLSLSRYPYWWNMVCWLTGNAINQVSFGSPVIARRCGSNSGIGGDTADGLLARLPDILAKMPENHLVFHIGTNSVNSGMAADVLIKKLIRMATLTLEAGITPLFTSILPRNAVDGAGDWSNSQGGTTTAQKRFVFNAVNNYMKRWCRENGIRYVDFTSICSTITGDMITGGTQDSVHPSGSLSYFLAKKFINDCSDILPLGVTGQSNGYGVYDAANNPFGNVLNGKFSGTGGNIVVGGGTGTVTGTVPDNWQLEKVTSTTTSVAAAIVARTDGTPGNVLELTFTATGGGSATEEFRLNYWNGSSTILGSFGNAGDLLRMGSQIEYVGGHGGILKHAQMRFSSAGGAARTATTISFDAATKQIRDSANGLGSFVANRCVYVSGSASNNLTDIYHMYRVKSVSAGVLQLDTTDPVITEAAGASITITQPQATIVTGSSATTSPDVGSGKTSDIIYAETGIMEVPNTGNMVARFGIYIDGTKTGTGKIRIALPELYKIPFRPALMDFVANDD